jgi:hypothetical protein
VQELRRIAEAVAQLKGSTVDDVEIRSDCRRLRIKLMDGQILLISVLLDEHGKARLDVDVLRSLEEAPTKQLEVPLGAKAPAP